ncbi:transcription factor MYB3R-3 [Mercurialis annua]|uniref:transcription factor MYB3R-3 n=1 Tax=Mercurialis annua TaxID=3986 RepID=UPI00215DE07B|nr:transcription factor MYB3R-3 [Mercurialis annua]
MVERLDEEVKSDSVKDAALVSLQGRITGPTRRSTQGGWTEEEDKFLVAAVAKYNQRNWRRVAQCVPGRTYDQCLHRWQKVLDPALVKGPWKKEEDDLIIKLVEQQGNNKKWSEVAKHVPGRIGKQCRERWHNHLNPDINRTPWSKEEEQILIKVHAIYGNKWAEIAKYLDRRTENSIKNHWNCSMRKKLESLSARDLLQQNSIVKAGRMNLDSVTHISRNIALGVHSTTMAQPIEPTSDKGNFQFPSREAIFGKTENRTPAAACPSDVECRERTHVLSNSLDELQSATPSVPLTLSLCTPSVPDNNSKKGVNHGSGIHPIYSSPESIWRSTLRKAAISFKHTPSIIRKNSSKSLSQLGSGIFSEKD